MFGNMQTQPAISPEELEAERLRQEQEQLQKQAVAPEVISAVADKVAPGANMPVMDDQVNALRGGNPALSAKEQMGIVGQLMGVQPTQQVGTSLMRQEALQRGTGLPMSIKEWNAYQDMSPEQQDQFLEMKRTMPDYMAESLGRDPMGYERRSIISDAEAKMDVDFAQSVREGLPQLIDSLENTTALREAIQAGQYSSTGPLEGRFEKYWNPETARLMAKNIAQTLENLNIANLAPVTENELALVRSMYADISNNPESNIEILLEAEDILRRKVDIMRNKYDYYQGAGRGSLAGYDSTLTWPERRKTNTNIDDIM